MKIERTHHLLAYIAAGASALFVILAGISRLVDQTLGLMTSSYMSLATLAILFAIYFLIEGAVYAAMKGK